MNRKKILIISYYWPPSGAIGVQRCLKFAKYLKKMDYEPIIYTAKNAQYPFIDNSGFKDIPEGITILKRRIFEPFNLFKFLSGRSKDSVVTNPVHIRDKKQKPIDKLAIWIRGNFFIPDARALWIKPSVRYLSSYIKKNPIDAVISDGPPHTNTVIACRIAKKFNLPWIADFQDPWTQVDYYKEFKLTKRADRKHRTLEQQVFKTAQKITIASPTWKKDLEKIGAKNVDVIYWGYDEDDFKQLSRKKTNDFVISHAGLLGHDRKPSVFIQVLQDLKSENKVFAEKLKLILAGSVDYSIKEEISTAGLDENTKYLGSIPREQALMLTINSDLLLLPLNQADNAMGRIPGKLFEQMRSGVPILCLGPKGSDVETILLNTKRGESFEYSDISGIKSFISAAFNNHLSQEYISTNRCIEEYSVENQVKKLHFYLADCV